MTVTSTKFQQNVGYYLKLAETGTIISILKSKPKKNLFQLVVVPNKENSKDKDRLRKFFKKLEKENTKFDFYGNDSVKFVREIRE
jgi:N6-adenosine-specific RNA methylase IME4